MSCRKEDWLRLRAELDDLKRRMAEAMARGDGARRWRAALARGVGARRWREALARGVGARRWREALARGEDGRVLPEEHWALLTRWCHDALPELRVRLGEVHVQDDRFEAHHDRRAPGRAQWWRNAIVEAHA